GQRLQRPRRRVRATGADGSRGRRMAEGARAAARFDRRARQPRTRPTIGGEKGRPTGRPPDLLVFCEVGEPLTTKNTKPRKRSILSFSRLSWLFVPFVEVQRYRTKSDPAHRSVPCV